MKESYIVAAGVFAVILMTGTLIVVGLDSKNSHRERRPLPEMPSYRPAKPPLPPVQLIRGAVVEKGPDGSWDYGGHVNDNFVTTRARLISSLSSQSWKLNRTIVLDEVLSPKTIFTFVSGDYEMTVLLSRRNGNVTDFFYKIEKCQATK